MALRAPFPWFGGKSRAARLVWPRFGDTHNYVEPFAGSLATLLLRPHEPRVETVNDLDCYLANFWRALQHDPEQVAYYADTPVNEADLHARHRWLVQTARERAERTMTDPEFYDAKIAGCSAVIDSQPRMGIHGTTAAVTVAGTPKLALIIALTFKHIVSVPEFVLPPSTRLTLRDSGTKGVGSYGARNTQEPVLFSRSF